MRKSGNRSSHHNQIDEDDKLKQYMLINKQISKTLTTQRLEIANLKDLLRISTSEMIQLKNECLTWKNKFFHIRQMYVDHIESMSNEIQTNAAKLTSLSNDGNDETVKSNGLVDQSVSNRMNGSKNANDSRRQSRSFNSSKNRSGKSMIDYIHTIDEEDEVESSIEMTAERKDHSDGREKDDANVDGSPGDRNTDEDTTDSDNGSESNEQESEEASESSDDESGEKTDESGEETDESGEETEESDAESDENDERTEVDAGITSVQDNVNKSAENESGSVEQISLLTTNCESTIKNDDSNKENESISTQTINKNSHSVLAADGQPSNKSTRLKSINQLPASKQIINKSLNNSEPDSIENEAFGSLQIQSLISSTPYRHNNNDSDDASDTTSPVVISTRTGSSISNAIISMDSEVSISSNVVTSISQSSTVSVSSRPKRRAAPVILSEPKLNTKLRRPR